MGRNTGRIKNKIMSEKLFKKGNVPKMINLPALPKLILKDNGLSKQKSQITVNIQSLVGTVVINSEKDIEVMKEKIVDALEKAIAIFD